MQNKNLWNLEISRGVFLNVVCAELLGIVLIPHTKISIVRQTYAKPLFRVKITKGKNWKKISGSPALWAG
ncbi:MAG TPA: hypothetical protein PLX23_10885 [Candidatus Hydrogenedens sp.]|mgnify:CR=1 FL=1|nr:hypothetical protein [Candidatus Hydrogenedens sp.]